MRIFLLCLLLLAIDWFAFQAVNSFLVLLENPWRSLAVIAYWALPVLSILYLMSVGRSSTQQWPRARKVFLSSLIIILYFSKLITALVMILENFRRGIAWALNGIAPEQDFITTALPLMSTIAIVLGLVPLLSLTYGMLRNPYRYKVFRKTIEFPGLAEDLDGLRIVQISDIHSGSFMHKERVGKSVPMINALDPDVVFFTGDLVNSTADEAEAYIDIFSNIKSRNGVFSIVGNHDYGDYRQWPDKQAKVANFEKLKRMHKAFGWDLLLNSHRTLRIGDATVSVVGVENYSAHPRFQKYGNMQQAIDGMKKGDLNILLSHDPSHWDDEVVAKYPWVDLTLSGHTHGFQFGIEMPWLRWSPVQYVYKRWAGLYRQGMQYLYVNRGFGFLGYPGRVGILPEITLLTIRKG